MPTKSQRLVVTILIGSAFLTGVDMFIVNVAFAEIGHDFRTADLAQLSWILSAYAVVFAAFLVPMGRLADRYGQKTGFVAGLAVFTVASLACGFAPGVWWLVAFRSVQAIGAAAMTPASLGLLLAAVEPERRAPAARLWATTGAVAAALGPAVGGGLVQISWQWAFWINLPIGVLLVVGALRHVPDVRHNDGTPIPDLAGAALLVVAVGALVLGIVQGNDWGWGSTGTIGAFAIALLATAAFVRRTTHHPSPVVMPSLVAVPAFRWATIATFVFNGAFGAALLGGILWMQEVWDYGALRTGLAVAVGPLAVPITSVLAHRRFPGARPGPMIAVGSVVFAASALWQASAQSVTPAYATHFLPAWILGGIGVGLAVPNLLAAGTATLPPQQSSTGGGVVSMARQVGLVLGVAVLVSVVDGAAADPSTGFRHAWYAVAVGMLLAAAAAVRMDRVTVPTPQRDAAGLTALEGTPAEGR
ncbi:MFS transporter [Nocardioides albidus]|uniref:MFS transporter n=1 Tax=Nocardioides albidus TaxID=1517589 RepID=A0A5C4WMR2_9ACTN|nr:MFS transporter [Nocardioides albidus]TNM49521.1 MFS transporter [Nocardioides albidus]